MVMYELVSNNVDHLCHPFWPHMTTVSVNWTKPQVGFNVRYWLHCHFVFLELKSFLDNNRKSEITTRWRSYSGNLRKIFNIVGQTTQEKIWINCFVQQGTDYHAVYSDFFLSFWTNDVEDFPKVTWILSPPSCHLRFAIVVLETF